MRDIIPNSVEIRGGDSEAKRIEAVHWFKYGKDEHRVLISKPRIFGFGMNFQHCDHMTYFPTHSYEQYENIDPNIHNITITANYGPPSSDRTLKFESRVTDASGISDVYFAYKTDESGGVFSSPLTMTNVGGDIYRGSCTFSKQADWCEIVVTATDNAFNENTRTIIEIFP